MTSLSILFHSISHIKVPCYINVVTWSLLTYASLKGEITACVFSFALRGFIWFLFGTFFHHIWSLKNENNITNNIIIIMRIETGWTPSLCRASAHALLTTCYVCLNHCSECVAESQTGCAANVDENKALCFQRRMSHCIFRPTEHRRQHNGFSLWVTGIEMPSSWISERQGEMESHFSVLFLWPPPP